MQVFLLASLVGAFLIFLPPSSARVYFKENAPVVPGELLVRFHPSIGFYGEQALLALEGLRKIEYHRQGRFSRLKISSQRKIPLPDLIRQLSLYPQVEVVQPNYIVRSIHPLPLRVSLPEDSLFTEQWALHNTGQVIEGVPGIPGADIDALRAWEVTKGSPDIRIAVIDTGVYYDHLDLASNVLRDEQGGVVGFDFITNTPNPIDQEGHGTHVSGIIGAVHNNLGIAGVMDKVSLIPLRFLDGSGNGSTADAVKAIDWAIAHRVRVINASWGGVVFDPFLLEAIRRAEQAGIVFVTAAGNGDASGLGVNNDRSPLFPAGFSCYTSNTVAVSATDNRDQLAPWSNYGPQTVLLSAPGVGIWSDYYTPQDPSLRYRMLSGTSQATPHVTGAVGLLLSIQPNLTPEQILQRLRLSAEPLPQLRDKVLSGGRLSLSSLLERDSTPPASPQNLQAEALWQSVKLSWVAPGDDTLTGQARRYRMKYLPGIVSSETLMQKGWEGSEIPPPGPAGTLEQYTLTGLSPSQSYTFGIIAYDNVGLPSPLSLVATNTLPGIVLLREGAESSASSWIPTGKWGSTQEKVHSGGWAWTDSPGGPYSNSVNTSLFSPPIDLRGVFSPQLSFWHWYELEPGYDFAYVEVSTNGGQRWSGPIAVFTGSSGGWRRETLSLAGYEGTANLRIRFRLESDSNINADGWYLDDIQVTGVKETPSLVLEDDVETGSLWDSASPWQVVTDTTGNHYWSTGSNPLGSSLSSSLALKNPLDLRFVGQAVLTWKQLFDLETGFDFGYVEVSVDGGNTWSTVYSITGSSQRVWQKGAVDLTPYVGRSLEIRFRVATDPSISSIGWSIDDIQVWNLSVNAPTPLLSIGTPGDGQRVGGTVLILPVASGNFGRIQLLVDGQPTVEGLLSGLLWDSSSVVDGPHRLQLRTLDLDPPLISPEITVVVDNTPPQVEWISPGQGSWITGGVELQGKVIEPHLDRYFLLLGKASDPVQWKILLEGQGALTEWKAFWDTREVIPGQYTLRFKARDQLGNETIADRLVNVYLPGDLDGDGGISVQDLLRLLRLYLGEEEPTERDRVSGDLEPSPRGDGLLDGRDLNTLLRRLLGL